MTGGYGTAVAGDQDVVLRSDVHSAEQTALALQSLAASLTRRNPSLAKGALMRSIDALFEEIKSRDDDDAARFAEKLAAVRNAVSRTFVRVRSPASHAGT